jgi:hypothetical protein
MFLIFIFLSAAALAWVFKNPMFIFYVIVQWQMVEFLGRIVAGFMGIPIL